MEFVILWCKILWCDIKCNGNFLLFVEKSQQEKQAPFAAIGKPPDVESEPTIVQESTEIKSGDNDMKPACEPEKIVSQSQPSKIPVKDVMADNSDNHEPSGRFTIFFESAMYIHVCIHAYLCIKLYSLI